MMMMMMMIVDLMLFLCVLGTFGEEEGSGGSDCGHMPMVGM